MYSNVCFGPAVWAPGSDKALLTGDAVDSGYKSGHWSLVRLKS
jgi:hypothetical protein